MKKIVYYGITFLMIWHGKIFSQDEIPQLFENLTTIPISEIAKVSDTLKDPINKEFRFVRFSNLAMETLSMSSKSDTYFKFEIPKGKRTQGIKNILSIPRHIEAEELGSYTYYSDLTYGKYGKGSLVLMYENGHSYGSMQLGNRYFRIESLSNDVQVLIELDSEILNSKDACATDQSPPKKNILARLNRQPKTSCNSRNVQVLILFTEAVNRISNPNHLANTVIANTNRILYNSKINSSSLKFQLAGVKRINWNETENPNKDLKSLVTLSELNTERQNHGADLVVVLTNGNYKGTLGLATLNQYSNAKTGHVAIVQAYSIGGLTFAHELGHLMGCRHEDDKRKGSLLSDNLSETAKGHVWHYRNWFLGKKKYQKSIVTSGLSKGSRMMHYSNPNVKAHKKARDNTGNSVRNNYQQLLQAAALVSCYNSFEKINVYIDGPSIAATDESINLIANVYECDSSTYKWEVSHNGFSYSPLGTEQSVTYKAFPNDTFQIVRFRLTVSCSDGQDRTAFKSVYFENDCGDDKLKKPCVYPHNDKEKSNKETPNNISVLVYPNPASNQIRIVFNGVKNGVIKEVTVYDMLSGEKHRLFRGHSETEKDGLLLDVSILNQGLYQLIVKDEKKENYSTKMLIQR